MAMLAQKVRSATIIPEDFFFFNCLENKICNDQSPSPPYIKYATLPNRLSYASTCLCNANVEDRSFVFLWEVLRCCLEVKCAVILLHHFKDSNGISIGQPGDEGPTSATWVSETEGMRYDREGHNIYKRLSTSKQ